MNSDLFRITLTSEQKCKLINLLIECGFTYREETDDSVPLYAKYHKKFYAAAFLESIDLNLTFYILYETSMFEMEDTFYFSRSAIYRFAELINIMSEKYSVVIKESAIVLFESFNIIHYLSYDTEWWAPAGTNRGDIDIFGYDNKTRAEVDE